MEQVKRIPYGVSNFVAVMEENQYYVDKTRYIPALEKQPDKLFFIRPRRFGKSLFLDMLHAYYDCSMKDRFKSLFGNLWIGKHPTSQQGQYQILHLDFSLVGGGISDLEDKFNAYCSIIINDFACGTYRQYYSDETVEAVRESKFATNKLNAIKAEAKRKGYKLYLIVDEYDNFTNAVLNEQGEDVYWALTHANGFYRDVFKVFKGVFDKIFMTGVSPVTLDDLTSGFNVGWHISTHPEFNQMLGFSTEDVREMFEYYKKQGSIRQDCDVEKIIEEMKPWYDNYCFSKNALETQSKVFNCDMVLYFLRNYIDTGEAPEQMIDPNTKTDYNKMKKLLQLDRLDGNRKGIIRTITETGEIVSVIEETFPAKKLVVPQMFTSLLFYYGMLTIKGTRGEKMILGIPNNNVRKQYYEYLMEQYEEIAPLDTDKLTDYYYDMAYDGKWREGLKFMADAYTKVSSVRDGIEAERNLQGFFMAYLSLNNYYYTAPELELDHGFCDFFLLPNLTHYASKHSYILELKVLPKKDFEKKAENQWQEAVRQINHYATAPRVEVLRQGTQLHKIIMQFCGWDLVRMEEV